MNTLKRRVFDKKKGENELAAINGCGGAIINLSSSIFAFNCET